MQHLGRALMPFTPDRVVRRRRLTRPRATQQFADFVINGPQTRTQLLRHRTELRRGVRQLLRGHPQFGHRTSPERTTIKRYPTRKPPSDTNFLGATGRSNRRDASRCAASGHLTHAFCTFPCDNWPLVAGDGPTYPGNTGTAPPTMNGATSNQPCGPSAPEPDSCNTPRGSAT